MIEHESILINRLHFLDSPKTHSKSENRIHESGRILKYSQIFSEDFCPNASVNYQSLLVPQENYKNLNQKDCEGDSSIQSLYESSISNQ